MHVTGRYIGLIYIPAMEQLSPTAYVILGMVRKEPRSGYEQIYPELKRLSAAGLIEGVDSPTGGRRRTVYEITADGEEELRAWLRRPPTTFEMREEGLLKLFFADALPPGEAVAIVRAMRAHRLEVNAQLRSIEALKGEIEDPYPKIVLRGGIEFTQWFADWCERMEEEILTAVAKERST